MPTYGMVYVYLSGCQLLLKHKFINYLLISEYNIVSFPSKKNK